MATLQTRDEVETFLIPDPTESGVTYRVAKTTAMDNLANTTTINYNIQTNGPFYVSLSATDTMLSNLTASLTWLSNNMVSLTSNPTPPQ